MNADDRKIGVTVEYDGPDKRASSGFGWMIGRWVYARWIQIIACGDLLGRDKRPSQSKLAAFAVTNTGIFCAIWNVTHGQAIGASNVTIVLAGLSASFGMKVYGMFLQRNTWTSAQTDNTNRTDTTQRTVQHNITETIERKLVADPDGDYEVTR